MYKFWYVIREDSDTRVLSGDTRTEDRGAHAQQYGGVYDTESEARAVAVSYLLEHIASCQEQLARLGEGA